jgi:hypothetical protein
MKLGGLVVLTWSQFLSLGFAWMFVPLTGASEIHSLPVDPIPCELSANPFPGIQSLARDLEGAASALPMTVDRVQLPPRITSVDFDLRSQFCERPCPTCDWRQKEPGKRLGMIAFKTHYCDGEEHAQACLRTTRELADPCNAFIQNYFSVAHTRIFRAPTTPTSPTGHYPYSEGLSETFERRYGVSGGPSLLVFDISDCNHIEYLGERTGTQSLGLDYDRGHEPITSERHRSLENGILQIPGVAPRIRAYRDSSQPRGLDSDSCIGAGPSLDDLRRALDQQDEELVRQGVPAVIPD